MKLSISKLIVSLATVTASALVACGAQAPDHGTASSDATATNPVVTDEVEIVKGIPDRGRDPAVVAIDIAGTGLCTGTLIASNVVLTARHCVAHTVDRIECPATSPQVSGTRPAASLHILSGDDAKVAREVARGQTIVAPKGWALCDADIALIILDREVAGIEPLSVRRHGVAMGDHVRAVGYGRAGDGEAAGVKLLRDHVKVMETTDKEFIVGEATCQGDSGGPAIDESTGEVVGVVSRGGPQCDGSNVHNLYTRSDAFLGLVDEALREAGQGEDPGGSGGALDAGTHGKDGGHHKKDGGGHGGKPPTDIGGACHTGHDCASGICVKDKHKQYCSRGCGASDHCPTHYACEKTKAGKSVCVAK